MKASQMAFTIMLIAVAVGSALHDAGYPLFGSFIIVVSVFEAAGPHAKDTAVGRGLVRGFDRIAGEENAWPYFLGLFVPLWFAFAGVDRIGASWAAYINSFAANEFLGLRPISEVYPWWTPAEGELIGLFLPWTIVGLGVVVTLVGLVVGALSPSTANQEHSEMRDDPLDDESL